MEQIRVKVWDLPVRIFHWTLVGLIVFQFVSINLGGDWKTYHVWGGYAILTLIVFRIAWGFIGSSHARFSSFLCGPRAALDYVRTLPLRSSAKFAGHNPLGGWSVMLMLLLTLVQAATGLFSKDDVLTEGPLARLVSKETSNLISSIHSYNFYVLLTVIGLHLAAVLFYYFYKSENLTKAMLTGEKILPATQGKTEISGTGVALVVLGAAAAAVWLVVREWK